MLKCSIISVNKSNPGRLSQNYNPCFDSEKSDTSHKQQARQSGTRSAFKLICTLQEVTVRFQREPINALRHLYRVVMVW